MDDRDWRDSYLYTGFEWNLLDGRHRCRQNYGHDVFHADDGSPRCKDSTCASVRALAELGEHLGERG